MAERQGFEPWEPVKAQRFSRPPRSTTPAPLRIGVVRPFRMDFTGWQGGLGQFSRTRGISLLTNRFCLRSWVNNLKGMPPCAN